MLIGQTNGTQTKLKSRECRENFGELEDEKNDRVQTRGSFPRDRRQQHNYTLFECLTAEVRRN